MKSIITNTLKVLSPHEKSKLVKLVLSDFIVSVLDIVFLIALLFVVTFYTKVESVSNAALGLEIFKEQPLLLIVVFFVLFGIKNLFAYYVFKEHYKFVYDVASRVAKNKLVEYLTGDYKSYVEVDSSVHIYRIGQQPIEFCHYVLKGFLQIISQALLLAITLGAILLFNAQLFILLFVMLVPPVVVVGYILKKKLHAARTNAKSTSEKTLQHLQEALSGFVESKIHNKAKFFTDRYCAQQNKLNQYLSDQQVIQNIPPRFVEVFAIFGLLILIVINSLNAHTAALSITTIGAFVAASYKIIPGIGKIMNSIGQVKTYAYTCQDLLWVDRKDGDEGYNKTSVINSIKIDKVSFDYNQVQVLNNFSMQMSQGDFLGMSGPSGQGKTTLVNLLLGFISPAQGNILFNDLNTSSWPYWKNVSYVKQQPFLINDTIRTNITMNESSCDDSRLIKVMDVTGLKQIVQIFPNGLDTIISEQGKNLSGGQRQRIALARALYKNFDLLVLDEPFSELDEESEISIMNYLQEISVKGKIVVLITHNKRSLSFCNKTVMMNGYN